MTINPIQVQLYLFQLTVQISSQFTQQIKYRNIQEDSTGCSTVAASTCSLFCRFRSGRSSLFQPSVDMNSENKSTRVYIHLQQMKTALRGGLVWQSSIYTVGAFVTADVTCIPNNSGSAAVRPRLASAQLILLAMLLCPCLAFRTSEACFRTLVQET